MFCGCSDQVGRWPRRYRSVRKLMFALVVVATAVVGPSAAASPVPGAANCPMFPDSSVWHADVSHLPVHPSSAQYVASIGTTAHAHADFGSGTWDGGPI